VRTTTRPAILDIEASGFGATSYPIEIGVVLGDGRRYCSLIAPLAEWTHWDAQAARLHGITRAALRRHGRSPVAVACALNDWVGATTLYSDGWVVDERWLRQLYFVAGVTASFRLSPLESILGEAQLERWHATQEAVRGEQRGARHRASHDAYVVQETYVRTALACRNDPRVRRVPNSSHT
jgi:hypothetical protein